MSEPVKYFYKGKGTDLMVYAKSRESVDKYLAEPSSNNLSDAVEVFQIFTNSDGRGSEGQMGRASNAQIENELGKQQSLEHAIGLILQKGTAQTAGQLNARETGYRNGQF